MLAIILNISNRYIARTKRNLISIDYSGRSAHALKRVQRTGIAV